MLFLCASRATHTLVAYLCLGFQNKPCSPLPLDTKLLHTTLYSFHHKLLKLVVRIQSALLSTSIVLILKTSRGLSCLQKFRLDICLSTAEVAIVRLLDSSSPLSA